MLIEKEPCEAVYRAVVFPRHNVETWKGGGGAGAQPRLRNFEVSEITIESGKNGIQYNFEQKTAQDGRGE